MVYSQEQIVRHYDPAPLVWRQHRKWHHDRHNTCYWNDYGYDDSVKSHRHPHEDLRPHVWTRLVRKRARSIRSRRRVFRLVR